MNNRPHNKWRNPHRRQKELDAAPLSQRIKSVMDATPEDIKRLDMEFANAPTEDMRREIRKYYDIIGYPPPDEREKDPEGFSPPPTQGQPAQTSEPEPSTQPAQSQGLPAGIEAVNPENLKEGFICTLCEKTIERPQGLLNHVEGRAHKAALASVNAA